MAKGQPQVSIGLPVYNGERYLAEAIEAILAQTFTDFELILSDNASTDQTQAICQRYVAQDRRVHYIRNSVNVGAAENHNQVFRSANGRYFKWAGHDDHYAPEYLARCVAVLDREPSAVLCYPKTLIMDGDGQVLYAYEDKFHLDSPVPHERFRYVLRHPKEEMLNAALGLTRTSVLQRSQLIGNYFASDRVLLSEIALYGTFYEVPANLFYRRIHEDSSSKNYLTDAKKAGWFNPVTRGKVAAPRWKRFLGYWRAIHTAPLSPTERLRCYQEFARFYINPHRASGAALDLSQSFRSLSQRLVGGRS